MQDPIPAMETKFHELSEACTHAAEAAAALQQALRPDENFIPNAQIERHFNLAAPIPQHLTLENFPPDLPQDFDHQLLRRMGLLEQCCLLYEPCLLGWRVTPIKPLVELLASEIMR